ncbi:MAG: hypothetical protein VW270_14995 [Candidatus Poseidoniales archaeon]
MIYYKDKSNLEEVRLSKLTPYLNTPNTILQTRQNVLDSGKVETIKGRMEQDQRQDPETPIHQHHKTEPTLIFKDNSGNIKLGASLHTTHALREVGSKFAMVIVMNTEHFFDGPITDPDVLRKMRHFSTFLNNSVADKDTESKEDCSRNMLIEFDEHYWPKWQEENANVVRMSDLLGSTTSVDKELREKEERIECFQECKSDLKGLMLDLGYTSGKVDYAIDKCFEDLKNNLKHHGSNFYQFTDCDKLVKHHGESLKRAEIIEKIVSKEHPNLDPNFIAKGPLDKSKLAVSFAALNNCYTKDNLKNGSDLTVEEMYEKNECALILNQNKGCGTDTTNKEECEKQIIEFLIEIRNQAQKGSSKEPIPNCWIYIIPCLEGQFEEYPNNLYRRNLRDL